nr:MAG TPA: hypothetical protein [Caudoviricetes sp.]DAW15678.1 MAG TPA: hypothetical protein [Caudoviricetes sp.]
MWQEIQSIRKIQKQRKAFVSGLQREKKSFYK